MRWKNEREREEQCLARPSSLPDWNIYGVQIHCKYVQLIQINRGRAKDILPAVTDHQYSCSFQELEEVFFRSMTLIPIYVSMIYTSSPVLTFTHFALGSPRQQTVQHEHFTSGFGCRQSTINSSNLSSQISFGTLPTRLLS